MVSIQNFTKSSPKMCPKFLSTSVFSLSFREIIFNFNKTDTDGVKF
jgi:hypothetical protein